MQQRNRKEYIIKKRKKIREEIKKRQGKKRKHLVGFVPPIPQANCLSASHSFFFFLVYFCDAWFVCHHPISKHNTHPQSSSSSAALQVYGEEQRETLLTGRCVCFCQGVCVCVSTFGGGQMGGRSLRGCRIFHMTDLCSRCLCLAGFAKVDLRILNLQTPKIAKKNS